MVNKQGFVFSNRLHGTAYISSLMQTAASRASRYISLAPRRMQRGEATSSHTNPCFANLYFRRPACAHHVLSISCTHPAFDISYSVLILFHVKSRSRPGTYGIPVYMQYRPGPSANSHTRQLTPIQSNLPSPGNLRFSSEASRRHLLNWIPISLARWVPKDWIS